MKKNTVKTTKSAKTSKDKYLSTRACTPNALFRKMRSTTKKFLTIQYFLILISITVATQGVVVSGFVSSFLTTIERRYGMSSTQISLISVGYDVASIFALVPVSYYGGRGNKPKWIAVGSLLMGIGSFIFILPHFLDGPYTNKNKKITNNLCQVSNASENSTTFYQNQSFSHSPKNDCMKNYTEFSNYFYLTIMIIANMCHSLGSTPLYTIAISYIDENTSVHQSPMYFALYYSMAMLGPAIGYIAGGAILRIYVDFGRIDTSKLSITHQDPDWLGAWWIGFVATGFIFIILSVPLSFFPKHLPNYFVFLKTKIKRKSASSLTKDNEETTIFEASKRLLSNSIYNFINMSGVSEGALIAGFVVFAPKYVEAAYHIPATAAGQIIGLATIPSGCIGMVLGGYLVKRLNMTVAQSLKFSKFCVAIAFFFSFGFLVICPEVKHAGINHPYSLSSKLEIISANIESECNMNCSCSISKADFVCGADGLTYISACHAGCIEMSTEDGNKNFPLRTFYENCKCVEHNLKKLGVKTQNYGAYDGLCAQDCYMIVIFLIFYSGTIFVVFIIWTPIITTTIHIVPEKQKSMALAVQWIVARVFGMIPARVVFGKIIDSTCIYSHKDKCGKSLGACPIYGSRALSSYFMAIMLTLKVSSFLCLLIASIRVRLKPSLRNL